MQSVPLTMMTPDATLTEIMDRVRRFDWSAVPDAGGWSAGTGLIDLRELVDYWLDRSEWRVVEARINSFPNHHVEIDGFGLHYIHLPSQRADALPLLLLHGWPGSILEFLDAASALANPAPDEPAFHLVICALPGFGLSSPLPRPIGPRGSAALMRKLMAGLGYERYIVQGGDWGSSIATWTGHDHAAACLGLHLNMVLLQAKGTRPQTPVEAEYFKLRDVRRKQESGYSVLQASRPQTLAFAMMDSPVGVAAWIMEKFALWSDLPWIEGRPQWRPGYGYEELLANIMLYLVTGSFATSTWMYFGRAQENSGFLPAGAFIAPPVAVAAFPDPIFPSPPRTFVERTYNVTQWTDMPRGGHFAAFEAPDLFVADIRAFGEMLSRRR